MNRKRVLLYILLAVLAISIGYAYWATPRQERVASGRTEDRRQGSDMDNAETTATDQLHRVRFDLLGEEPAPFSGAERDIFNFRQKPVKIATPPPAPAPMPAPVRPAPPVVPQVSPQPLSKFEFLGFLEKAGKHVVFLSSADEIYVVREGERFGRNMEFEVADIAGNTLTVQRIGQPGTEKISLVEKEKQDSSVSAPARLKPLPMPVVEDANPAPVRRSRRPVSSGSTDGAQEDMSDAANNNTFQNQETPVPGDGQEGDVNGTN